ncbi:MAG: glycosidase [Eubacteriales bacterium]|nr:glycosidase [Eubacteriales bacterium]
MNNGAMLNAYPDSLDGTLSGAVQLLSRPEFKDVFRSFYVLPSIFNTDLDRGFSVISYALNRLLATQQDIDALRAQKLDLKLDFILNHLSVLSPQFQSILKEGDASPYRDFFIDWNKFWEGYGAMTEGGYIQPEASLLKDMFFRKPGLPILMVSLPDGKDVPYWNTFYQEVRYDLLDAQDLMSAMDIQYGEAQALKQRINDGLEAGQAPSAIDFSGFESYRKPCVELLRGRRKYLGQMDLNLQSERVWEYYDTVLGQLAAYGASIVRLDAFAYAPKRPGARNFLNEPDTWEVLERVRGLADKHGLTLLPEIHASYGEGNYAQVAEQGYMTYDFFLPGLLIDALENHNGDTLVRWIEELRTKKIRTVNMLGCHDGIPMLDLKGLIPEERIQRLIDLIVSRGGLIKNLHGQKNVYYQVNATYYSALGADDRKLLLARALQLFTPGKPQVWYLDLFAGENDLEAVQRGGAAGHKEINRTNLSSEQLDAALRRPVVQDQLALLRMRNTCPAFDFDAELTIEQPEKDKLLLTWSLGEAKAVLRADLSSYAFTVEADTVDGPFTYNI